MTFNKLEFTLLFYFSFFAALSAQIGSHSAHINWKQINTPELRLIFPEGFEQQGQRVSNLIHYLEQNHKRSIGLLSQKLNVVLHNQTIIPNGFVGIAPFRSEFFATPPQSANFLGTVDWLDALTIHEYRHALQFSNAKVGITKLFYYLQGDNGWGLLSGASIPNWFWEGDATVMETALSLGGRGRAPFFTLEQRALLHQNRLYSYEKARNRSYKDLVPNHYPLGYAMIMHARKKYGNDIWKGIFNKAARYKPLIYPFSNALKQTTGLSTKDLYYQSYRDLQEQWAAQIQNLNLSPTIDIKTKKKKTVTNYRFPYYLKDGSIICLKSSYRKTDALIHIKNGKEKILTHIGFHIEKFLSVSDNKIVWTEYEQDSRRSKKNYSNIVFYDLKTQQKTRLTHNTRFFSPDFSNSGGRIITVQISSNQENALLVLNAQTGATMHIVPNPDNYFLSFPKWADNDTDILYIAKHQSRLAIFKYNLIEKQNTQLTDWTHHTIADLYVKDRNIYFTSSFSGIDNIYRVSMDGNRQIHQISSVPIGAFYPSLSADGKSLIFSEFTDMGYKLSALDLSSLSDKSNIIKVIEPYLQAQYTINHTSEEGGNILDKIPNDTLAITPYKGFFKGLKLHSWNFTPSVSLPTLDIQFDNMLDDFSINLIGGYNFNEDAPVYVAAATYGKWYPLITGLASLTNRNAVYLTEGDSLAIQSFDQTSAGGRVLIPLSWAKNNYRTNFQVFAAYFHRFIKEATYNDQEVTDFSVGNIQLGINFSNLRRTALQNLGPRWGQSFNINFQQTTEEHSNQKINIGGDLYFPGIGANHNLKLGFAYQRELLEKRYQFSDNFEYPKGFGSFINDEFLKLSANYQLPLFYPDWGFAGIIYFKRLSANLFFDHGKRHIHISDLTTDHNSVGAELIFDTNFWNELPVTFGIRNAYLLTNDRDKYQVEFFVRSFIIE